MHSSREDNSLVNLNNQTLGVRRLERLIQLRRSANRTSSSKSLLSILSLELTDVMF